MKELTSETILIGKAAHLHLERIQRQQRGCKPLNEDQENRLWDRIPKYVRNGEELRRVNDFTYGGGDGTYDGRWWPWTTEDVKKILAEAGFTWEDAEPIKYIPV